MRRKRGRVGKEKGRAGDGEKGAITRLELGIGGAGKSLGRGKQESRGSQAVGRGQLATGEASLAEAASKSLGKGLMHWIHFCIG